MNIQQNFLSFTINELAGVFFIPTSAYERSNMAVGCLEKRDGFGRVRRKRLNFAKKKLNQGSLGGYSKSRRNFGKRMLSECHNSTLKKKCY